MRKKSTAAHLEVRVKPFQWSLFQFLHMTSLLGSQVLTSSVRASACVCVCVCFLRLHLFTMAPTESKQMGAAAVCGKNMKNVIKQRKFKRVKCPGRREDITYASLPWVQASFGIIIVMSNGWIKASDKLTGSYAQVPATPVAFMFFVNLTFPCRFILFSIFVRISTIVESSASSNSKTIHCYMKCVLGEVRAVK